MGFFLGLFAAQHSLQPMDLFQRYFSSPQVGHIFFFGVKFFA
jgi:hypothetical protein